MRFAFVMILSVFMLFAATPASGDARAKIMVLGTFHFDQPGLDLITVGADDVLGESRQREIEAVVERLAEFAPTKIAVEMLPHRMEGFNARYLAFREGRGELGADEKDQLGMRLAARLGHEQLFGVDHVAGDMDFGAMMGAGAAHGQHALLAALQQEFAAVERTLQAAQGPDRSIGEMLAFHNGPWVERGNALYLRMARLGGTGGGVGADQIGAWYVRNLHIYANIVRLVDGPDARVLVIFGSGHRDLLTDFVEESADLELVSPLPYLD